VVFGVADDRIAGASEIFLCRAGDRGIESGKCEVAIERGFQSLDHQIRCYGGNWLVEVPFGGLRIFLSARAFGGCNLCELEPRMAGEKLDQALADDAGGAEDSGAKLLSKLERFSTHAAPLGLKL
jgi:hypothetical protein